MRTFSLDMIPGGAQTAVACNQYEAGDVWVFALYYDGGRYSIPEDAEVSITGTKPDGAAYKVAGTVTDNAVVIEVTEQMTACAGRSIAEILVESETDGTTLYSANFPLLVEPAAVQGDLSPSEIPSAIVDTDGNIYYSAEYIPEVSGSVPTEVRQAMKTLFQKAAYIEEGLADEVAVVQAWAEATTSITVSPSTASVSSASPTAQLSAVTTPAGGAVTWASSNTAVATVSSTGLVTAVGNGTATVTATSGTVSASCAVTVTGFATLTGITAVYSGGSVTDSATLDDLKSDLVVTASYDNGTTATVTDYTLSGTLSAGTSTITVSYGGFTDSFTVTVTTDLLYKWDLTKSLTDEVAGQVAVASAGSGVDAPAITNDGLAFTAATQMLSLGNINLTGKIIEIDVESMDFKGSTSAHVRFLSNMLVNGSVGTGPIVYRKSTGWSAYVKTTGSSPGWTNKWTSTQDISLFNGKTVKLVNGSDGTELYLDGELLGSLPKFVYEYGNNTQNVCIAGLPSYDQSSGDQCYDMVIGGIRIKDAEDAEVSE